MQIVTVRVLAPDVTSISQGDQCCPVVDGVVALPASWLPDLGLPWAPAGEAPSAGVVAVAADAAPLDAQDAADEVVTALKAAKAARPRRKA